MNDIPLAMLFGILLLLILLSAFFSGSETALMTINRYRLRHMKNTGHPGAIRADKILKRPDRLIGLILLGNNFVNILASSLATIIAIRIGGESAIAVAALILTMVILIFAEVTPKTLAALHPERLAFPAAFIYKPLLRLLYPLIWIVNWIANGLLHWFGVTPESSQGQTLSQDELRTVVAEAEAMVPKSHQKMLLSILDLENATVEEIMIPRNEVDGIDLEDTIEEIINQLETGFYTRIVVFDDGIDNLVGVVHIRNAMIAMAQGEFTKKKIREMAEEPYYIPEGTPLNRQLLNFQQEKKGFGLVVDEYGDLLGLITLADVLEEIVGEFTTDPSDSIPDVQPQQDGSFLVAGNAEVRELVKIFKWDLPEDGPRTLNGVIIEYMETIPQPGTSLLLRGYPMEILQSHKHAIKMVRIWPDQRKPQQI
ncbi:MAG: HlyC/CorC family transporter [Gammaproteobacteria bacterium]|nr:HlyC/CorC family transporter [Gammaproteobacteria bacterium]